MSDYSTIAYEAWNVVAPTVGVLVSIVAVPLIGVATASLYKWFGKLGLDIDQKNRDAFQTAITNAALYAVSKMGGPAATNIVTKEAIAQGVDFVQKSVPDAIKHFDIKPEDIAARIKPQAEAIVQSVPTTLPQPTETILVSPLLKQVQKV